MDPSIDPAFDPLPEGPESFFEHLLSRGYVAERAEIGKGGQGVVYRAWQKDLARYVAIKRLREHVDRQTLEHLRAEARTLASLRHPGVVAIHEVHAFEGVPYLVMDFVGCQSSGTSRNLTDLPPFEGPSKAVQLILQVARTLSFVHQNRVIHHDIKPENILISPDLQPVLADFGIAKVHADSLPPGSATLGMWGSIAYMAPEQFDPRPHTGPATDQWSLAAILYELLAGRPPMRLEQDDPKQLTNTIARRLQDPDFQIESVRGRNPKVPPSLESIVHRALERAPADRYPSVSDFADDLERFLASGSSHAHEQRLPGLTRKMLRLRRRLQANWVAFAIILTLCALLTAIKVQQHLSLPKETAHLFQDWSYRWGVPHGIQSVSPSELPNRSLTYRLWTLGPRGPVIRCEAIGPDGRSTSEPDPARAPMLRIHYEPAGTSNRVRKIEFLTDTGKLLHSRDYQWSSGEAYRVSFNMRSHLAGLGRSPDEARKGDVTGVLVSLEPAGFEDRLFFLNAMGQATSDREGASGYVCAHDGIGRLSSLTPLRPPSRDRTPAATNLGKILHFWDGKSRRVGTAFLDDSGNPIDLLNLPQPMLPYFVIPDSIESFILSSSNPPVTTPLVKQSEPMDAHAASLPRTKPPVGIASITNRHDSHGNCIESAYFNRNGQPAALPLGLHRTLMTYASGRITRKIYERADGSVIRITTNTPTSSP